MFIFFPILFPNQNRNDESAKELKKLRKELEVSNGVPQYYSEYKYIPKKLEGKLSEKWFSIPAIIFLMTPVILFSFSYPGSGIMDLITCSILILISVSASAVFFVIVNRFFGYDKKFIWIKREYDRNCEICKKCFEVKEKGKICTNCWDKGEQE